MEPSFDFRVLAREKMKEPKPEKEKIKQSETVIIKRSQINFAAYNPRKKDPKIVDALKRNFKKVGYLGGIVHNKLTGNLVAGHKRVEAMDLIYGYDGTPEKDYDIKVEQVDLDDKTEKEQNIFLNNKRVQGEMDYELLAEILPDIDIENTGLIDYDLQIIQSMVPDFEFGKNDTVKTDLVDLGKEYEDKKQEIKDLKKKMKNDVSDHQTASYFTVTFKTYDDKAGFLEQNGIDGDSVMIRGEDFTNAMDR